MEHVNTSTTPGNHGNHILVSTNSVFQFPSQHLCALLFLSNNLHSHSARYKDFFNTHC